MHNMKRNNNWVRAAMLLLLTVLNTIGVRADDYKIVVWLNDGSKTEVNISDMPEFVYADGNVSLKSGNAALSWPLAQLNKFTFEGIGSMSYAMEEVDKTFGDAPFTNDLTLVGDGTVTYTSDNVNVATVDATTGEVTIVGAGTATITATATDGKDYTYTTKTISYTITVNAKAVENGMLAAIADQTYTGRELMPAVTVKDGETTLTENTDYTVGYANNVNVGTATVTITGMGNYSGTASTTFTILADKTSLDDAIMTAAQYYYYIKDDYPSIAATLQEAIEAAQAVADKASATQEETDTAKATLDAAMQTAMDNIEIATGIRDVRTGTNVDVWYDMNGRKRQGEPAKNGLIIKNGKKMVVKNKQDADK
jgi:hypothetical protein